MSFVSVPYTILDEISLACLYMPAWMSLQTHSCCSVDAILLSAYFLNLLRLVWLHPFYHGLTESALPSSLL
jgi:hypothetical protein